MPLLRVLLFAAPLLGAVALATAEARSSSTCATAAPGDRPPAVAGRSIRAVYAVASDGNDRRDELAPRIAADVKEIGEWWRSQDPSREPRFDLRRSPCGVVPDIGVVRLPETTAELRPTPGRSVRLSEAVLRRSDWSPFRKYLVYYDGPVDPPYCGRTEGEPDGAAVAIVFPAACPSVPTAVVAAHELAHALGGAAQDGPPHECASSEFHVCDSTSDILYPAVPRSSLATMTLDVGRDDYYGHAGGWLDVRDSRWLRTIDRQVDVTVTVEGDGLVVTDIPGLACTRRCTTSWDRSTFVVFRVRPAPGRRFLGWRGACNGKRVCGISVDRPTRLRARFGPA